LWAAAMGSARDAFAVDVISWSSPLGVSAEPMHSRAALTGHGSREQLLMAPSDAVEVA